MSGGKSAPCSLRLFPQIHADPILPPSACGCAGAGSPFQYLCGVVRYNSLCIRGDREITRTFFFLFFLINSQNFYIKMSLIFFKRVRYLGDRAQMQSVFANFPVRFLFRASSTFLLTSSALTCPLFFKVDLIFGNSQKIFEAKPAQ